MPTAKPTKAYAPETSHNEMPGRSRSAFIHHAVKDIAPALASATTLSEGRTSGVLTKFRIASSGITEAAKILAELTFIRSVGAVDTTTDLLLC
jgi:hypothetical protein